MNKHPWQTGVAQVVSSNNRGIVVSCPHCPEQHTHQRSVLGSSAVVAGCHKGFTTCREYSVPGDLTKNNKRRNKRK